MSSTTTTSPTFQSILDATLESYAKQTGIDLTNHPSADKLQDCRSSDDVLRILSERESAFKDYRDKYHNLIDRLGPVVQVVHAFSAVLGEVAGFVSSGIRFSLSVVSLWLLTGTIPTNEIDLCRGRCSSLSKYPLLLFDHWKVLHLHDTFTSGCDWHQRQL
jgi:STAND-like protein